MKEIINQVFLIQQKSLKEGLSVFDRNIERVNREIEELGYTVINPLGQKYSSSMTDVEANIVGDISVKMRIVKVLKPIIYKNEGGRILIQKGIVIVE